MHVFACVFTYLPLHITRVFRMSVALKGLDLNPERGSHPLGNISLLKYMPLLQIFVGRDL